MRVSALGPAAAKRLECEFRIFGCVREGSDKGQEPWPLSRIRRTGHILKWDDGSHRRAIAVDDKAFPAVADRP